MELHIPIYIEKENLNTSEMEGEFLLSTLSSLAEGESVSISENSKWAIQNRFQDGTYKLCSAPYGYRWDGKNLVVEPVQAKVVKRIFAEVLAGKGAGTIAAAWCCGTHIADKTKCSIQSVRDEDIKLAFTTMLNKLIYGNRLILKPYLKALKNTAQDESQLRIQYLQGLVAQNTEQRETLTRLMAQGYID